MDSAVPALFVCSSWMRDRGLRLRDSGSPGVSAGGGQLCKSARRTQALRARRSKTIDFAGWREQDNGRLRGQQESGEEEMMGVSLLSDGQRGSLSKQQISMLPCSSPPPPHTPIHQLKQRGARGELREGRSEGSSGGSGVRQRGLTSSQGLNPAVSHCWPGPTPAAVVIPESHLSGRPRGGERGGG